MHLSTLIPAILALISTTVHAYRPVQFVKHTGQSGRADQAFSLVNYFNTTTQTSDLYIRMWMFRYGGENKGWASLGLGPQMKGALMFIIYGDPATDDMTLTIRTASGHHPPRPLDEMKEFYEGEVPDVEVVRTGFEAYTGDWYSEQLKAKPSHLGVAEFIVRGYEKFTAPALGLHAESTNQAMIWSSNFKQDFEGDYSFERAIDMHAFGLGFGFLWVDFLNARSEVPFFQDIDEVSDHSGLSEIGEPATPSAEELSKGAAVIAALEGASSSGDSNVVPETPENKEAEDGDTSTPGADNGSQVEAPVKTIKQWNIRSWMWYALSTPFLFPTTNISLQAYARLPHDSLLPPRVSVGSLPPPLPTHLRLRHSLQLPLDAELAVLHLRQYRRPHRLHELTLYLYFPPVSRHLDCLRTSYADGAGLAPSRHLRGE